MKIIRHKFIAGVVPAVLLASSMCLSAISADTVVSKTTLITACGRLFEIDSNAAGLTAEERARIVQKNLDNALIAATNRTPSAVRVEMMNRNPIVTLDGRYIVTADANSAARNRMSQLELAHKWADSISFCLADATAMSNYLALLTGNYPAKKVDVVVSTRDNIAVATTDMLFPVQLATPLSASGSQLGDKVEVVVSSDVPLGPTYEAYIPAGTVASGEVVASAKYLGAERNNKNGLTIDFYEFKTPDGHKIPIAGHIYGGINTLRRISIQPTTADCCGKSVSIHSDSIVKVQIAPAKGNIVGSWKSPNPGIEYAIPTMMPSPRFSYKRDSGLSISAGEPMMLQLSTPTSIAIATSSM